MRPGSHPGIRGQARVVRSPLWGLVLGLALSILAVPWPAPAAKPVPPVRKEILAAAPANFPPYFLANERGEPDGFAVALLLRVAAEAGYSVRLLPAQDIREAERMVRDGRAHLLPGLGYSESRAETLVFSSPFDVQSVSIYVREGAAPVETLDRLAGRRVVLAAGSIPAEMLAARKDIALHPVRTLPEGIFAVLTGEADALVFLDAAVEQAARAAGVEHRLRRSQKPVFEVRRAFAALPEHAAMLADLDNALDRFRDTDEFRQIYRRWHPAPKPQRITPEAFWSLAVLAVASIVCLLAWRYVSLVRLNRRMAVALSERDQALAALRLTEERLEALFALSHMEATSSDELVRFALEQGVRLTGSGIGYLFFTSGENINLASIHWSKSVRDACDLLPHLDHTADYPLDSLGLWAWPLRSLAPVIINDFAAEAGGKGLPQGHCPLARYMAVPLVADGKALAVFGVGNKPGPYDDTDARQLQLFLNGLWRVLQARRDAEAIEQARDYAESLLAGANAMVIGLDREGRVTAFNAAAEAVTGLSRAEALGQDWFALLNPREKGGLTPELLRATMDGRAELPGDAEGPLTTRQGQTRRISWRNSVLRTGGRPAGVICFGIDVTARREAEEALREQSEETLALFNGAPAMIFYKSTDDRLLRANDAWFRSFGLDESALGRPLTELIPADIAERFRRHDLEVIQSGSPKMNILERVETPRGVHWFIAHKMPRRGASGEITGVISIATDITEQRLTEEALAESEEKFRTLAEDSPALIGRFLPGGILTYVNPALAATFAHAPGEMVGRCLLDFVPAHDHENILRRFGSLTPQSPVATAEQEVILPGGRAGWQQWTDRALFDAAGDVVAFQSVGMDITERRRTEENLRVLHRAMEQAAEGVLITDGEGAVTFVNPALERMTGHSAVDIRRLGPGLLEPARGGAMHQPATPLWEQSEGVWLGSHILVGPEGQATEVESTVTAVHGPDGEVAGFITLCRDVTEKRLLERQLWQAQKMEALGTLAGGIAHDFNNILASILGFTELALDDIPPEGRARASLERVLKASRRARELVRQILTFGRRTDRAKVALDADQAIGEALRLMEASLPKEVTLDARLAAPGCSILADPSQVHQIVLNLCTNAAQAMAGGGRITVATRRVRREADASQRLPGGDSVVLTVEDTGPGIPPENLDRIFEPFFTTKGAGQGTGLGLAVVHGIAGSLGGSVQAGNAPGGGALLTVHLPVTGTAPAPAPEPPAQPARGRERILLVDDEADLLDLSRQALAPLGYRVEAFRQPQEALEAFLAEPETFGLLLTDQNMPDLSGDQLAARMRLVRADLPVLLCTGDDMALPRERLQTLDGAEVLAKPFTPAELALAVRRALDAGAREPGH